MDQQPSSLPVRSGIPRPTSRLPVLRSTGSQSQLRSPSSVEQLRKKPSVSSLARPSQPPATLQKKTSRTSLPRSTTPATAVTSSNSNRASLTSTNKRISAVPTTGLPRTSSSDASSFKKPIGRPPSRQTRAIPPPTRAPKSTSGEDVLGDLEGFRSASRASSRASSRAGFRDDDQDFPPFEDQTEAEPVKPVRKSRPSLSERTIESLSQLPSSPAVSRSRRRSSFFNADGSMPPPGRPASALSNGRPMTSDGTPQAVPSTPSRLASLASRGSMTAPGKRSVSAAHATSSIATPSKAPSLARPSSMIKKQPLSQLQNVQATSRPRPLSSSKTMVARTPKSRPSIAGAFGQAISPTEPAAVSTPTPTRTATVSKTTPVTSRKISSSSAALREQIAKAKAARRSDVAPVPDETPPKVNSSQALREQIAKARAAKRSNATREPRTITPPKDAIIPDPAEIAGFDFGLEDPFNQGPKGGKSLMRKRLDGARADGRLNIAAMGLKEMPEEVLNMYKYDPNEASVGWGEVVDLTVLIAADNELQTLPEKMFPDVDYATAMESDDDDGPQFGGIQNMDLHGNLLRELPPGLRHLTQLSKLNLSRNKLPLEALDVVSQLTSLRELRLAENELDGAFPASIEKLDNLEILDLQCNKITSLPTEIGALLHLRILNVSENKLSALPTELFTSTPIVELAASKNAFSAPFFDVDIVAHLQKLQLGNNSLTALCRSGTISLPALKHLDVSSNRVSDLPDMTSWTNLATLLLGENKVSSFPEGFFSLQQLRHVDLTGNDLTKLDERIGLMEALEHLTLAANPLRDRKFLTMDTEDIKRDLRSRLAPEESEDAPETLAEVEDEVSSTSNGWQLTPSGTLDLSFQNLTEVDEDALTTFSESNDVKQLYLQQNYLTQIPMVAGHLTFLSVLDLSKNNIVTPLAENLELPKLRELRLAGNKMSSLSSLTTHLSAPKLEHLDISHNRLGGELPALRDFFPALLLLLASDNSIAEVSAESLQGLKTVNLSNNDISRLEPRIGLHAGTLTSLDVEGNRFRVPNYAVLKKGTDAVLNWLRDRIPSPSEEFFSCGSPDR